MLIRNHVCSLTSSGGASGADGCGCVGTIPFIFSNRFANCVKSSSDAWNMRKVNNPLQSEKLNHFSYLFAKFGKIIFFFLLHVIGQFTDYALDLVIKCGILSNEDNFKVNKCVHQTSSCPTCRDPPSLFDGQRALPWPYQLPFPNAFRTPNNVNRI
jgi:hypothetical protein